MHIKLHAQNIALKSVSFKVEISKLEMVVKNCWAYAVPDFGPPKTAYNIGAYNGIILIEV